MRHAANMRSVSRQRGAPTAWNLAGELRPLNPDHRPRSRYGRDAATVPDVDRDERDDAKEWDET